MGLLLLQIVSCFKRQLVSTVSIQNISIFHLLDFYKILVHSMFRDILIWYLKQFYENFSVNDLLSKIYFENYKYHQLKNYTLKAFLNVTELDEF